MFQIPFYLAVADAAHGVDEYAPVVEITDNTDGIGIRCPHRKADTAPAVLFNEVSSQHFLGMIVCTLMKEVKIKLAMGLA